MKFKTTVSNSMTIRLPAVIVQAMNINPGDCIEVTLEHMLVSSIANSEKFTDFCRKLGSAKLSLYHKEFLDLGGKGEHGSFKTWLVKRLELPKMGLSYWVDKSEKELFPDGKLPLIEPVGPSIDKEKKNG